MRRTNGRMARGGFAGTLRALTALAIASPFAAHAVPVDLNQFYREPGAPVSIAADGSSATFLEDPSVFLVYLSNVPGLGDPELLTASAGATFSFDYNFVEAQDNEDIFHFSLLDGISGGSLSAYELFFGTSASGTATFDLSALTGTTLGMQFELLPDLALDLGFGSSLTISNLRVDRPVDPDPPVGVPEPGTWVLMLAGLALMCIRGASRYRDQMRPTR